MCWQLGECFNEEEVARAQNSHGVICYCCSGHYGERRQLFPEVDKDMDMNTSFFHLTHYPTRTQIFAYSVLYSNLDVWREYSTLAFLVCLIKFK